MTVDNIKIFREQHDEFRDLVVTYFECQIQHKDNPYLYQFKSWKFGKPWDNEIVIYYTGPTWELCEMYVTFEELENYSKIIEQNW